MSIQQKFFCLDCNQFVPVKREFSAFLIVFFLIAFGWIFGVGIVTAVVYYLCCPKICANCKGKNLWLDNPTRRPSTIVLCRRYSALQNGECSSYRLNSCVTIRSLQNLEIFNKLGFFCPHQEEIRETAERNKQLQIRWSQTFEKSLTEPIPEPFECPFCHAILKNKSAFCTYCGAKLRVNSV